MMITALSSIMNFSYSIGNFSPKNLVRLQHKGTFIRFQSSKNWHLLMFKATETHWTRLAEAIEYR